MKRVLKIHPSDNVSVALQNLKIGEVVGEGEETVQLLSDVSFKHKFLNKDRKKGDEIIMYGVVVGEAIQDLRIGQVLTTENIVHRAETYDLDGFTPEVAWKSPDPQPWQDKTFMGYHREDGSVGTQNVWLVIPLVFCENRNILVLRKALEEKLGYGFSRNQKYDIDALIEGFQSGLSAEEILEKEILISNRDHQKNRLFKNVDGLKFITQNTGCGERRQDSIALCQLLAGYVTNPNVAGATILSLGCQNAEVSIFMKAVKQRNPDYCRPLYVLEQQKSHSEKAFIAEAVKKTFIGLMEADSNVRRPAGLDKLTIGLECGGSDGFSGISANPTVGHCSDLLVALGGSAILAEFPELNGVEQELVNRCTSEEMAQKFLRLMTSYHQRAKNDGSGFYANPSPGNIKDGLITDAMKSAGAAKKGGTSPVKEVLDYTEKARRKGLSLLCTPGNDVESTTGIAASGANLILFTTGLGTPTGNPAVPVIKISSNSNLFNKMPDIIDFNTGGIIDGETSIEDCASDLLEMMIEVASGRKQTKATILGQDDFIPWRRGISL